MKQDVIQMLLDDNDFKIRYISSLPKNNERDVGSYYYLITDENLNTFLHRLYGGKASKNGPQPAPIALAERIMDNSIIL